MRITMDTKWVMHFISSHLYQITSIYIVNGGELLMTDQKLIIITVNDNGVTDAVCLDLLSR